MESGERNFFNSPRTHVMRNLRAHANRSGRKMVSAFVGTEDAAAARAQWRCVTDQLRSKLPSSRC